MAQTEDPFCSLAMAQTKDPFARRLVERWRRAALWFRAPQKRWRLASCFRASKFGQQRWSLHASSTDTRSNSSGNISFDWITKTKGQKSSAFVNFSVSLSEKGGIDINLGSSTIHIPKRCSVRRPVLKMVLLAFKKTNAFYLSEKEDQQDTFSCARSVVPKAILDIVEKPKSDACGTDVFPVYEAGVSSRKVYEVGWWVAAKKRSTRFTGGAVGDIRTRELADCKTERSAADSAGTVSDSMHLAKNPTAAYVLATTQSPTPGDGNWTPALWLDSGATHHAVGDASVLCNLQDPPAGKAVRMADGVRRLPVTKVGDIQTENIKIPDVYLVPGLQMNVVSVRQLAKSKIVATFYEHHAELWREGEQVGGAIADDNTSLYRLCYLAVVGNAAAPTS